LEDDSLTKLEDDSLTKDHLFILLNSNVQFDWSRQIFRIEQSPAIEDIYNAQLPASEYKETVRGLEVELNDFLRKMPRKPDALMSDIKIHKPEGWKAKDPAEIAEMYYSYSPYRSFLIDTNPDYAVKKIVHAHVMDILVKEIFTQLYGTNKGIFDTLPAKYSADSSYAGWLRDDVLVIDDNLYQPDELVMDFYPEDDNSYKACLQDMHAANLGEVKKIPFKIEGGNMIACSNRRGEKIMLLMISNHDYNQKEMHYKGSFFLSEDLEVTVEKNYIAHCERITEWGKSLGYKTIIVESNLSSSLYEFRQMYHLDVCLNVVDGFLVIPEGKNDEHGRSHNAITEESLAQLVDIFGQENVIRTAESDREKMVTNFIEIDRVVVLPHPDISKRFILDLIRRGFVVAVPPIKLTLNQEDNSDSIRCHTNKFTKAAQAKPLSAKSEELSMPSQ